jgi:hypothetical protein
MGRKGSFEERARDEVARIQQLKAAEEERKQERMRELAKEAREHREVEDEKERKRKAVRDAKLRQVQEEEGKAEERRAREGALRQWKVSGGTEAAFEWAWPSMWEEMLKRRTMDAEKQAREDQRARGFSRI